MKPTLQLKLSQHLTLTPQLQQSIKLLQLSTLELNQELERFLLENPMLLKTTALSVVTIVLATELGILQWILRTVGLSIDQWVICILVGASIVVVAEIKKLLRIRTDETAVPAPASAAA